MPKTVEYDVKILKKHIFLKISSKIYNSLPNSHFRDYKLPNCQLQDTIDTDTSLQDYMDHRVQSTKVLN